VAAAKSSDAAPETSKAAPASSKPAESSASDSESPHYGTSYDSCGDRAIYFAAWNFEELLDNDWSDFKYPRARDFIILFREAHAIALICFFSDKLVVIGRGPRAVKFFMHLWLQKFAPP
jgi:hypothetical protein